MYGLEEYYNDLLNEAKSPEEIKRILVNKFVTGRGVPEEVLDDVLAIDPTKKKSYTSWLLNLWQTERPLIEDSLENGQIRMLFHYFQTRNNEGLNLCGIPTLREALDMLPEIDTVIEKIGNGPENDFDIVYDTPEWKIAVPHSYPASEKLGKGCKWCTAGAFGNGPSWYEKYTRTGRNGDGRGVGPLWINFDYSARQTGIDHKEYPYTRYQFLFEWDNYHGEFMDYLDHRIDPSRIPSMPDAVREFYISQNERYRSAIEGDIAQRRREQRQRDYDARRQDASRTLKTFGDGKSLILMPDRDGTNFEVDNVPYRIYFSDDLNDPVSNTIYPREGNPIIDELGAVPGIITRDIDGNEKVLIKNINGFTEIPRESARIVLKEDYCFIQSVERNGATGVNAYALSNSHYFIFVGEKISCLGKPRKIIKMFRNDRVLQAYGNGSGTLEIELDCGIHMLYTYEQDSYKLKMFDYPLNGEYFEMGDGGIRGHYCTYNRHSNNRLYELIDRRYAIVRTNMNTFNVVDSNTGETIFENDFARIISLGKDGLLYATSRDSFLLSVNTRKMTRVEGLRRIQDRYNSYNSGIVLDDIQIKMPLSFNGIEFVTETPQQESKVRDFVGNGANTIRESFNNFYNRMLKRD